MYKRTYLQILSLRLITKRPVFYIQGENRHHAFSHNVADSTQYHQDLKHQ